VGDCPFCGAVDVPVQPNYLVSSTDCLVAHVHPGGGVPCRRMTRLSDAASREAAMLVLTHGVEPDDLDRPGWDLESGYCEGMDCRGGCGLRSLGWLRVGELMGADASAVAVAATMWAAIGQDHIVPSHPTEATGADPVGCPVCGDTRPSDGWECQGCGSV
jgi:hypothetical protein